MKIYAKFWKPWKIKQNNLNTYHGECKKPWTKILKETNILNNLLPIKILFFLTDHCNIIILLSRFDQTNVALIQYSISTI